jgi:hypothetical protein
LQQVVQALREAQEQVLEQAQELVRELGLAAAQVEELARAQKVALEWDLQPQARQAVEQVELLAQGPLVEL